ncbi:MAG: ankyrin repeat domain-containing protein [Verrucomicrobia bacterium]|nr:ankyrin repeat domain-containing protein [Verrucomicrobiota bacterium]
MKTLTLWLVVILLPLRAFTADALVDLLQKGLMEEEAQRDLPAAIRTYRELIEKIDNQRRLAATAVFRLGESYRKLGQTNEAAQHYQRLLREFPSETALAKLSEQNLAMLGLRPSTPSTPQQSADDTEDKEIRRLETLIQSSPDLLEAPGWNMAANTSVTPLQDAAARGQLKVVDFLLSHHVIFTNGGPSDLSPLHWAAWRGHRAVVQRLLQAGAPPSLAASDGYTALHLAAAAGRRQVAQLLIEAGADKNALITSGNSRASSWFNYPHHGNLTPLALAIDRKEKATIAALLEAKADVNKGREHGSSPLETAIKYGTSDDVESLFSSGADPSWNYEPSLYERLISRVPDGGRPWRQDLLAILDTLRRKGVPLDPERGNAMVSRVIQVFPDSEAVDTLLEAGADPNRTPAGGTAPLIAALGRVSSAANDSDRMAVKSIIRSLLKKKADPNLLLTETRYRPLTAVPWGYTDVVMMLLDAGADPNLPATMGHHLLQEICQYGDAHSELVESLLKHGANPNDRGEDGLTPLDVAKLASNRSANKNFNAIPPRPGNSDTPASYEKVIAALVRYGAKDSLSLPDFKTIRVYRESTGFSAVLFRRGTNDWNTFTLHEALGMLYAGLQAPSAASPYPPATSGRSIPSRGSVAQFGGLSSPGRVSNYGSSSWPSLAWPQMDALSIRRLSPDGGSQVVKVGRKDEKLQWGDVLEIPESTHPLNGSFQGLGAEWLRFLGESLSRTITLSISGTTTNVTWRSGNGGQPVTFSIDRVITQPEGLILSSSDLSRVKVERPASANHPKTNWVVDLVNPGPEPTLWIRDRDVITIEDYHDPK